MNNGSIATLIQRLNHSEYSERCKAEDALIARGEEAVDALILATEQYNIIPMMRAASALIHIGDPKGFLPVARLLLRDNQQFEIIDWLAQWSQKGLSNEAWELSRLARQYKSSLGDPQTKAYIVLLSYLKQISPDWAPPLPLAPLAKINSSVDTPDDIPGLLSALRSSQHNVRESATAKLIQKGSEAVPDLIEALKPGSPLVRYRAAEALGHIGDTRAVEPLLALHKTLDIDILEAVNKALIVLAQHLASSPCPEDIPTFTLLIQHLRFDATAQPAAISAAKSLAHLALTHPTPALRGALKWLKSLWAPLPTELKETRKIIEEATKQWKDLPLIADAPVETKDLPFPSDKSDSDD